MSVSRSPRGARRPRRRVLAVGLLAAAALAFGMTLAARESAPSEGDTPGHAKGGTKPVVPTDPRVSFLCTVSNVGYIEPCG